MPMSLGVGGAEAVLQPAIVGLDAGQVRADVLVLHEREHRALRRIEHLRVDAVQVHDLETLGAVVARGMDGGAVARAGPLQLLGVRPDAGDQPERLRRRRSHVQPGVTAVAVVDQLGRRVEVLLLEPALPEIGRLDGVRVAR